MSSPAASPPLLGSVLPPGRIAAVFNACIATLQADPILAAARVTIATYRHGYNEAEATKPEPDDAELPYIRVALAGSTMGWENEHEHWIEFPIVFTLYTLGPNENDMTNLMEATFQAFFPQDETQRAAVFATFRALPGLQRAGMKKGQTNFSPIGHGSRGLRSAFTIVERVTLLT